MITRLALLAAVVAVGLFALWHPAPRPPAVNTGTAFPQTGPPLGGDMGGYARHRGSHRASGGDDLVVYVAGSVKRPGLYHLRAGDRAEQAVALAGGFAASADAAGVNLAARASDGDEIYVPQIGERGHAQTSARRSRRHSASPPPSGSVDVNGAGAAELATVPGIGRAIAARIVALREREGSFTSLDELLDVAGMTQSRLERARPYLHEP
jgi:competence protein ComEA